MVVYLAAALTCAVIFMLVFYIRLKKSGNDEMKYLFRFRGVGFFPLNSFVYAVFVFAAVTAVLFAADASMNYSDWYTENERIRVLNNDVNQAVKWSGNEVNKRDTGYPLLRYPGETERKAAVNILVVGDSFVYGDGCTNMNDIWWSRLSNELESRGYDCAVNAVALGATGTADQLKWLTDTPLMRDLDPDIVIFGYVTNDPDNFKGSFMSASSLIKSRQMKKLAGYFQHLLPDVFYVLDNKLTKKLYDLGCFNGKDGDLYWDEWLLSLTEKDNLLNFNETAIQPLGEFAKTVDCPVILVTTPENTDYRYFEKLYKPVLPLFE